MLTHAGTGKSVVVCRIRRILTGLNRQYLCRMLTGGCHPFRCSPACRRSIGYCVNGIAAPVALLDAIRCEVRVTGMRAMASWVAATRQGARGLVALSAGTPGSGLHRTLHQFALQRSAMHLQCARRGGNIAVVLAQHTLDMFPFQPADR